MRHSRNVATLCIPWLLRSGFKKLLSTPGGGCSAGISLRRLGGRLASTSGLDRDGILAMLAND